MVRVDLMIFGATGFTGKYVVQEVINVAKKKGPLTWGIAGRNREKLQQVLSEAAESNKLDLKDVPVVIADASNPAALKAMAAQSKVVLNCCGPFRFYGEAVVKACVENGASHVDISGEPQYMESMQLKYHKQAQENGVYIVSACGFDSIPTDVGIVYLEKEFGGQVNAVETYLEIELVGNVQQDSALLHYTTWESAVYGVAHVNELGALRKQIYPERLPPLKPHLPARSAIHKSGVVNKWCLPFPGSDRAVVQRSQRFLLEFDRKRPVQVNTYVAFKNFYSAFSTAALGMVFGLFASFGLGRKLLLNHPKLFTLGTISHEGPSKEVAAATKFSVTIVGQGWEEKQAEPFDNPQTPPEKVMVVRVSGFNPGYGATAAALVASALTILRESAAMPGTGGVLAPGVAFAKTSIIDTLSGAGGGVISPGAAFAHTSLIQQLQAVDFTFQKLPTKLKSRL